VSRLLIDMPSGEYWASDSVQPDVRSVVDVLYHVYGKPAYFRGTMRRRQNTEQGLALTIAFIVGGFYREPVGDPRKLPTKFARKTALRCE
jgi:hypothetical protein